MTVELALFLLFSAVAVGAAVLMLLSENAIHSALFLIVNFACVAFMYLLLDAPFLSMVQVAVYAGAIMVLFLFVIMLLGAEKTTDTTRSFRWLGAVVAVAGVALLLILGAPLVAGGFQMPQAEGKEALLRVTHAARDATAGENAVQPQLFNVYLDDELVLGEFDFKFGEATEYFTLEPGDHTVGISVDLNGTEALAISSTITLEAGDVQNVVIHGEDVRFLSTTVLQEDLSTVEDRSSRATVFNLFSEETLSLVSLQDNRQLDTRDSEQTAEDGTVAIQTVIIDPVLLENIPFQLQSEPFTMPEGTHHLAFVNEKLEIVREFESYEVVRDTQQTLILGPETLFDGTTRSILIGHDHLTTPTAHSFGGPHAVGQLLFTDYVLPVQIVGVLLLVALVGVIVLTRPEGEARERRPAGRVKVSRPLINVISAQTGRDVVQGTARLDEPQSGD